MRLHSTLRTADARCKCGKYLTQTEHYFWGYLCTDCKHAEFEVWYRLLVPNSGEEVMSETDRKVTHKL